jgi:hypothetical protein
MGIKGFDAGAASPKAIREALETDGAFIVRGLLSQEEILRARAEVKEHLTRKGRRLSLGKTQPNAAILAPRISWILGHPRIVEVFKSVLGETAFTGHCDIHMNMLSGWHKDSGEHVGGYFSGDYFGADDCRVYKAAIYLQETGDGDGLSVRVGSHRRPTHDGNEERLKTQPGDVVFFDVRLSHAGQLPDLLEKGFKALAKLATLGDRTKQEPSWLLSLKNGYWKVIGRKDRLSIFFTYGKPNRFTEEFAEANMFRQANQAGDRGEGLPQDLMDALQEQQVKVLLPA